MHEWGEMHARSVPRPSGAATSSATEPSTVEPFLAPATSAVVPATVTATAEPSARRVRLPAHRHAEKLDQRLE